MAKYNLYRIWPEKRFELVEKLRAEGLEMTKKVEVDGVTMEFMFSREPEGSDIWWTKTYKDFLEGVETPKNISYCAAFFVYNDSYCYAVALGKSYLQIKNYCDPDFGLNLAERIASDRIKLKNSKFYKSRRNRIATTYNASHRIEFDSGESLDFIRATTVDAALWGSEANFGTAVQFSMEIGPDQLPAFVKRIEEVLGQNARINLPKVILIKDALKVKDLDAALVGELMDGGGERVVFTTNDYCQYSFYLQGAYGNLTEKGELNLEALKKFMGEQNINLLEQIDEIKIRVYDPEGKEKSKNLKTMLDFSNEENRTCLLDGKWYRYNPSFINFLASENDAIKKEKVPRDNQAKDIEEFINEQVKNGFVDCRKTITQIDGKFKINKLDLYKDGTLYFVKFGQLEAINYTVDQAINAVKYLQASHGILNIDGQACEVERICLWLTGDPDFKINKLLEIRSLNFLMKVADWKHSVINAGFRPKIALS